MLKGSDVGLIVGSEFAGKGTEILGRITEGATGMTLAPLHLKLSTYLPLVGILAVVAAAKSKYFKQEKHRQAQIAAAVYGSRLLASGVDVVQAAATPGAVFGLTIVPQATAISPLQPGITPAGLGPYIPPPAAGRPRILF